MTLNDILSRLEGVKGRDSQYTARCPAHDDRNSSLSVAIGRDGKILLHCHAGCTTEAIAAALGLKMQDLFPEQRKPNAAAQVVATYNFYDDNGKLLMQKLRRADKSFLWRQPDGKGGWINNRRGVPPRLYIAGKLSGAVIVCEGEKDADNLHKLGYDAASGENGAGKGKWKPEYTRQLAGRAICVLFDNDDVGRAYGVETANALLGVAASVQLCDLKTVWPEIPEHGDVSDMIAALGREKAADRLAQLIGSTPPYTKQPEPGTPVLIRACDVPYEPPHWLIPPYFQRGKGTMIQGDNGTGKTAFACAVAAHVSTGKPMLDTPVTGAGDVLILSVEDDLPVLRGRIEACGGDLAKCHFMTNAAGLTFNSPEVEQAVKQVKAQMVIFDPFQAFIGAGVDMFRSNETRPQLGKLFEMCERNDCACIIIAHTAKSVGDKSPVNRSLGSVDIPAAMRSIMQLIRNPDNEDECIMVHVKCSNAPKGRSIAYTIGERGGVHWIGYSPITADELAALAKRKEKGIPYDREPLVQVFNQLITDRPGGGFWSYKDLQRRGSEILGFMPFDSISDLRKTLDAGLARELLAKDGILVTHSEKGKGNARGIRVEQYKAPQSYQTKIEG